MNGVIYARYSCDRQTENSILGQVRECTEFAKREGIDIINIYKDEAISGRTALKRPSFMKMIHDSSLHLFDCVIVWKGDRFSRSRADAAKYKNILKKNNVRVLSATEANLTGAEAILIDGVNEAFAEYFCVELAEKVSRGMMQNAIDGKFNGGPIPFGYKKEGNKIVIDEERAEIVRRAFDLFINDDRSFSDIYVEFKSKGLLKDARGKDLARSSFHRIVRNPKYYGFYQYHGHVNMDIFPPIITKEIFDEAGKKMTQYFNHGAERKNKRVYLLSGKLICAECMTPMWALSTKKKSKHPYYYYGCPNKRGGTCSSPYIQQDYIEKIVLGAIKFFIKNTSLLQRFERELIQYVQNKTNDIGSSIKKNIKEIEKKMDNMIKAIQQGTNINILAPMLNKLDEEKKRLELELAKEEVKTTIFTPQHIKFFFENLDYGEILTTENKKLLINKLVKAVYVRKDKKITILFKYGTTMETGQNDRDLVRITSKEAHHCINILNTIDLSNVEFELYRIQRDKSQ